MTPGAALQRLRGIPGLGVWTAAETARSAFGDPDALSISVLDMKGISMKDVGGDVMDFVKRCSGLVQEHYPERAAGVYIINVPTWFSWVWALVRPLSGLRFLDFAAVFSRMKREARE